MDIHRKESKVVFDQMSFNTELIALFVSFILSSYEVGAYLIN